MGLGILASQEYILKRIGNRITALKLSTMPTDTDENGSLVAALSGQLCVTRLDADGIILGPTQGRKTSWKVGRPISDYFHLAIAGFPGWQDLKKLGSWSGNIDGNDIVITKSGETWLFHGWQSMESSAIPLNEDEKQRLILLGLSTSQLAHEIQTPLMAIKETVLGLLEAPTASSNLFLQKIDRQCRHLEAVVRGIKCISRARDDAPMVSIEISQIIEDSLELCGTRLERERIDFQLSGPTDLHINCRPSQMVQVLLNLFNNAMDAMKESPQRMIEVNVNQVQNKIVAIMVSDTGSGVAPEMAQKLMQPFSTSKGHQEGTGLGLYISKNIIQKHGGKLELDRTSAKTCFIITLPLET